MYLDLDPETCKDSTKIPAGKTEKIHVEDIKYDSEQTEHEYIRWATGKRNHGLLRITRE